MEAGKWYQIGVPFEQLDGASTYKISEAFSKGFVDGDMLYIMDPELCAYTEIRKWQTVNGDSGWGMTVFPILDDATVKAGNAVLIKKAETSEVSLLGKVNTMAQSVITGDNTWSLIAIQHPTNLDINSLKWSGLNEGDMLYVMDPELCAYTEVRKWQTVNGISGWGMSVFPILQDYTLTPGQAMLINKRSSGTATVSVE